MYRYLVGSKATCIFLAILTAVILVTSCSDDPNCINCTFDGDTRDICDDDLGQFTEDTGLEVSTLAEVVMIIELIGGSCDE